MLDQVVCQEALHKERSIKQIAKELADNINPTRVYGIFLFYGDVTMDTIPIKTTCQACQGEGYVPTG